MFPWNLTDKKLKSCWKFTNVAFHDSLCSDNLFSVPFYIFFFLNKWARINRANQSNVQNSCHWRTISIFFVRSKYLAWLCDFLKNALFSPPLFWHLICVIFTILSVIWLGTPIVWRKKKTTVMENAHLYGTIHILRKHIFRIFGHPPSN